VRLYFIYMNGCGACEAAKPVLKKWEKAHPEVQVIWVDLLTANWVHSWKPRATPTYVTELSGHRRVMFEGALDEQRLDQFVAKARQMMART